jgi:hypothetical protein
MAHQRLDGPAVRNVGDVMGRAQPVDSSGHIQPAKRLGSAGGSAHPPIVITGGAQESAG